MAQAKVDPKKTTLSDTMASMYDELSTYDCARGYYDGDNGNYGNGPQTGTYQIGRTFINGGGENVSYKSNYTKDDYEYYNGNEINPRNPQQKILLSMRAYDRVGIVRNVIDLMADFTCKGIKISHPNIAEQRFFKEWWDYVDGDMISERFINYLYRIANVPVTCTYGKVPVKIEKQWSRATGADISNEDTTIKKVEYESRRIPLKYTFINPLVLEVVAPELATFTGKTIFALRVSPSISSALNSLQARYPSLPYAELLDLVPGPILAAVKSGKTLIPIDNDNISMYYYRKDDWEVWAKPMISAILEDLIMFEKMKLTDMSALNGAVSSIRLWNVGLIQGDNPSNWIIPTKAMIAKVRNILANNVGGGTYDLVWGPDLKFTESQTRLHEFLGDAKYQPILANIYGGLGVPIGHGSSSTGSSKGLGNNFIAMQTFVERLEYGRRILMNFWNEEIKKVQLAMGYTKPAVVTFDQINLGDDTTYKQILLGLVDRDILSEESILESCGYEVDLEKMRIKREDKKRKSGAAPDKASPFHNPNTQNDMKKSLIQRGGVTPSQMGFDLPEPKPGEKTAIEHQAEMQSKYAPKIPGGRPTGAKDSKSRKKKKVSVQAKASSDFVDMFLWGIDAQKKISDIVTPVLLKDAYKKPNVRSLSKAEFDELEGYKFKIFSHMNPFDKVSEDIIVNMTSKAVSSNLDVLSATKVLLGIFHDRNDREPTVDEIKQIQSSGYALAHEPKELDELKPTSTELELNSTLI